MNASKSKVLVFERNEERAKCKITDLKYMMNGKTLEQVNELVYLGSMFSRDGRYEMDAERRIAGNKVNGAMRHVITAARLAVHNAVLVPTLLYDTDIVILQKKNERKMNVVEMRSLRRIYSQLS